MGVVAVATLKPEVLCDSLRVALLSLRQDKTLNRKERKVGAKNSKDKIRSVLFDTNDTACVALR